MATRLGDWTRGEVEAIVADYLLMLAAELKGQPYSKAEHNRTLQALSGRSHGSIERKHQNISAILRDLGMPWMGGYKPLGHRQALLEEVVLAQLESDRAEVLATAEELTRTSAPDVQLPRSLDGIQVDPPSCEPPDTETTMGPRVPRASRFKNYLEIDAQNRSLGKAGEEFVVVFEQRRLWDRGRHDLSKLVEHVAVTQGDGLGYDIGSFEVDGSDRLIEVKTTSFCSRTPFFISKNEVTASVQFAVRYQLYRVYSFRADPHFFALKGSVRDTCLLSPERYLARVG